LATYTSSDKQSLGGEVFDALGTFYRKRWLLGYFIHRQVTRSYRRSYLGLVWAILGPLVWVFFLALIFSNVIGIKDRAVEGDPTLNFGLFLYCGLLPFLTFSEALNKGINSIRSNAGLVQKVVFPLEILPFTNAIASMVDKVFGFGALLIMLLLFGRTLHPTLLYMPVIVVLQVIFILGLTYIMAVLGTFLPDVAEVMRPVIRGMFFVTPILWPPDRLPDSLSWIEDYNPLAYLVTAYRDLILNGTLPGALSTLYFALFSVALFIFGFALFVRLRPKFADHL
jgi:ABC-type polysaccharide/polyol phosphate export permease